MSMLIDTKLGRRMFLGMTWEGALLFTAIVVLNAAILEFASWRRYWPETFAAFQVGVLCARKEWTKW